ncbi:hypothetical protein Neosp_012137 [[Neocosmospora] mangrovei]
MHLLSWDTLPGDAKQIKIRLQRDTIVSDYAILSHRWGKPEDEVSYEDMLAGGYEHKKGYAKLLGCCRQARKDGLRHVWVDTCCINKSSSAELSEAITSMFAYYERAKVCYAILDDVPARRSAEDKVDPSSFSHSAWFTRGWTLQELIAPTNLKFFDASWSFLGYKTDKWLLPIIEQVTGVDSIVLNIPATTKVMSIAKKMSWAARRETTRVEDMAYSLMGIFGVYMPPLYGEGTHAFVRLQEAIMKTSNDQSIFAWTSPPTGRLGHGFEHVSTMLALSPSQFRDSSNFKPLSHGQQMRYPTGKLDYTTTNAGLSIRLPMFEIQGVDGLYAAFLACTESDEPLPSAIFLRTNADTPPGHFWKTNSNNGPIERGTQRLFDISGRDAIRMQDIYVLPRFTSVSEQNIEPAWDKVDMEKMKGTFLQRLKFPVQLAPTRALDHLQHVPDPGAKQLSFLHEAHHMIHTQQADKMIDQIKFQRRSRTVGLPARDGGFYGRARVLQKLADTFFPPESEVSGRPRICALSGIGGIGKTEVAVEFSHRCIENRLVGTVLWINANSVPEVMRSFSHLAFHRRLVELGSSDTSIIAAIKQWLYNLSQKTGFLGADPVTWLLVFDNADDASHVIPFLPLDRAGCVLLTSRDPRLSLKIGSEDIVLGCLTAQESQGILGKSLKSDQGMKRLSAFLGGHPLVLVRVVGFMLSYQLSPDGFILWFKQEWNAVRLRSIQGLRYLISLGSESSLVRENELSGMSSSSLAVLQVISMLPPPPRRDHSHLRNKFKSRIMLRPPTNSRMGRYGGRELEVVTLESELDLARSREELLGKLL